jgi:hypothetical protein
MAVVDALTALNATIALAGSDRLITPAAAVVCHKKRHMNLLDCSVHCAGGGDVRT